MCDTEGMKTFLFLMATVVAWALHAESKIWNRGWEFRRGDMRTWQACHLPHSFSAPYFLGPDFYVGDGWYRKRLRPEETQCENLFLDFEGAFQFTDVWLDGVRVGGHRSGYTGFRVDLTPALRRGQAQEVLVRVSNAWDARTAPRAGEHIFTGGINRDVRLVSEGPVHLAYQSLTVTTPDVSREKATVQATVTVRNTSAEPRTVACALTLGAPTLRGKPVTAAEGMPSSATVRVALPPKGERQITHRFTVTAPRLWSPETPHLYPLTVVAEGSEARAEVGLRWFTFTKERGFFLNGEHLFLLGANVHQDTAGWGDGVTNASHARDVRLMKEAGFNFIRGSHYPHDPAFLTACDREGMLFWSEGGVWGMGGCRAGDTRWNASAVPHLPEDRPAFADSAETLVREMVRDARNHPCVIAWSVCNEPFFLAGGNGVQEASKALVRRLLAAVREEDPTRPAAVGGAQRGGFDALGAEVIGYNGDGARLYRDPPGPSLVAEYGSVIARRPGAYAPGWGEFANDRPAWRSGAAVWCGFDHGSIWESGSRMGIADYFRLPKRAWFWYRNALRGLPPPEWPRKAKAEALRIEAEKTVLSACDGTDDTLLTLRLTDAKGATVDDVRPVTLTVAEGPGEFPTGRTITFVPGSDIDLIEGQAAIVFRSHFAGETRLVATAEGLPPAELRIVTQRGPCADPDADFVPGVSRQTPDRPYAGRYVAPKKPLAAANLAPNRPCRASSNTADAPKANDGDPATLWRPAADDPAPAWTLDLEFRFSLRRAQLNAEGSPTLEVSPDGSAFQPVPRDPDGTWRFPKAPMRYVRVRFPSASGALLRDIALFSE